MVPPCSTVLVGCQRNNNKTVPEKIAKKCQNVTTHTQGLITASTVFQCL
jgi:hypothetical protein